MSNPFVAAVVDAVVGVVRRVDFPFIKRLVIEAAQTCAVAAAGAGVAFYSDSIPVIGEHYGLSADATATLIAVGGIARSVVSGFNSLKRS